MPASIDSAIVKYVFIIDPFVAQRSNDSLSFAVTPAKPRLAKGGRTTVRCRPGPLWISQVITVISSTVSSSSQRVGFAQKRTSGQSQCFMSTHPKSMAEGKERKSQYYVIPCASTRLVLELTAPLPL